MALSKSGLYDVTTLENILFQFGQYGGELWLELKQPQFNPIQHSSPPPFTPVIAAVEQRLERYAFTDVITVI